MILLLKLLYPNSLPPDQVWIPRPVAAKSRSASLTFTSNLIGPGLSIIVVKCSRRSR